MVDRFAFYRFIAPFRSRLQARLREERLNVDIEAFARPFEGSSRPEVPRLLWDLLREEAFVADFRPDLDDSLDEVYCMGPEEVRDDVIEPILDKMALDPSWIDFRGFDFASVTTPREVIAFILKIANAQNGGGKRRFVDMV